MFFGEEIHLSMTKNGLVRISLRVSELKVEEHSFSPQDFGKIFSEGDGWVGVPVLQAKKKGGTILLRIRTNALRADLYTLRKPQFEFLHQKFLSDFMEYSMKRQIEEG